MIFRRLTVFALLAFFVLAANAQTGAAGKWNGKVDTQQGSFALVFELAVNGTALTGNMVTEFLSAPILEGTVKGDDVAFKLKIDTPDGTSMLFNYKGKLAGDEMKLVSKLEGGPAGADAPEQPLTLTRAK